MKINWYYNIPKKHTNIQIPTFPIHEHKSSINAENNVSARWLRERVLGPAIKPGTHKTEGHNWFPKADLHRLVSLLTHTKLNVIIRKVYF